MSRASCTVDDSANKVIYDREAFPELKKKNFSFVIADTVDGMARGEFVMKKGDDTVRYHNSEPFPRGALEVRGTDLNSVSFIVKLKKKQDISLSDHFSS